MTKQLVYALVFVMAALIAHSQDQSMEIRSSWKFRQSGTALWHVASVPGNVFADLFKNKLIDDPFYSDNEKKLQWVENENWEYQASFKTDKLLLDHSHIELIFEGLDTYAKVYLNDSLILSADNMFRSWRVDVKKQLKQGNNILSVFFESSVKKGKAEATKLSYTLPEGERVFARKAQFQYGWDFGPRFAGCGIWKPVKLVTWNEAKIESIQYQLKSITDSVARVDFILKIFSDTACMYNFVFDQLKGNGMKVASAKSSKTLVLKKGNNEDTLHVTIFRPKLWWSNGLGEPYLYYYSGSLYRGQKKIKECSLSFGLRTIELVNQKDSAGTSFYFKLNGKPVFMKGANYIPSDIFMVPKTKSEYSEEIEMCKEAGMNMLRVWGGGVYGDDAFYETCDEKGILVWQDFMFAGAMYPGDEKFTNNVKEEIKEQLIRLRNHPSLALWCGNNEIDEAWNNWGWQKQYHYTYVDSLNIWKDYQTLFHVIIPGFKNELSSQTPYWNSSPSIGWGRKESLTRGDSHYWGVWWGMELFQVYGKKAGRFMTEYGFQSMPDLATFRTFCPENELSLNSGTVKAHQKHKTGYETIQTYLERDYKTPAEFRNYIYVSQLLQRDGMKIAIEAHRRNKPYCMGTLFWQLNDCWPGTSWSALDYYGKAKAFYYSLKNLYKTQLVSVSSTAGGLEVKCLSDSLVDQEAQLSLKLLNFRSEVIWQKESKVLLSNSNVSAISIPASELPAFDTTACYLKSQLICAGKVLARNFYFFTKPKYLTLPKTSINIVKKDSKTFEISSPVFAKDVYLYDGNSSLILKENYFDLEAGEKRLIKMDQNKTGLLHLKAIVLNNL